MIDNSRRTLALAAVAATFVVAGCANKVMATRTDNPPPTEALSKFGRIEMKAAVMAPEVSKESANIKSLAKIQANLDKDLGPSLAEWNKRPDNGRNLIIEPVVEEIRFIGVGARIFAGPLAGSSAVRMTVKFTDAKTGKLVNNPEFYQRSSAGSGFALGVLDNLMLTRTANLASAYIIRNYSQAVGGPTGANEQLVAPAAK